MKRRLCLTVLGVWTLLAANLYGAGIVVPDGFEVDKLLTPLPSGFVHQIEAVRVPGYGKGVVYAIAGRGGFKINVLSDTGSATLTTIGPFPDGAEITTIRFDWAGVFQKHLLVGVFHDDVEQPLNYRTDIVKIAPDGTFTTKASVGNETSPMAMHFDVTDGRSGGYGAGMYLVDADSNGGTTIIHIDPNWTATVLGADVLPSGRTDFDPRGVEFAPTDTYNRFFTIAESSHTDGITAVYQMKPGPGIVPFTALATISLFEFPDMAFSPGNAFGDMLYVADSQGKKVMTVSSSGRYKTFATGFNNVQSISINDGTSMFVSDADAIYLISETPPPPPPDVELAGVAVSAGAGADSATGSRINLGQTAIGSMSNGTVIVHAGLIPRIKGAVLAPMFGDFTGNRTVDLGDYPQMNACLRGPGVNAGDACALGDSDNDSDVDMRDVGAYANAFGNAAN